MWGVGCWMGGWLAGSASASTPCCKCFKQISNINRQVFLQKKTATKREQENKISNNIKHITKAFVAGLNVIKG